MIPPFCATASAPDNIKSHYSIAKAMALSQTNLVGILFSANLLAISNL
jgi:hypothetical protein